MLQQPYPLSARESTSGMPPGLVALDNAPSLRRREWIRGEPGEDIPQQYTTINRCLTPVTPRHEKMRLDPSLNLTLEGSLNDLPAAVGNTEEIRKTEQKHAPEKTTRSPFRRYN